MRKAPESKAANPRRKLIQMKRLGKVIVGTGIEPGDFVGYLAVCGQDQHLGLTVGFPKLLEYGHTVDTGKVEVEHHEVKDFNA